MTVDEPGPRQVRSRPNAPRERGPITRARLTEDQWLGLVLDLAHAYGWLAAHFRSARVQRRDGSWYWTTPVQGDTGSPDLLLAHPRRHLRCLVELKQDGRYPDPEQHAWLDALGPSDGRTVVAVWRPKDEPEVRAILSGSWWPV